MAPPSSLEQPARADGYGPSGRSAWLDVDWRTHQRWVLLGERRVNVIDVGSGPPLLFVHGLSGCWQNWLENICAFAGKHRVIAVDLPGFGASEMPADAISISAYAATLDALCGALDLDAVAVVGNSMGGFVGAEMAIRFPERVQRLCLVAAAGLSIDAPANAHALSVARHADSVLKLCAGWVATRSDALARRARVRRVLLSIVAAHPERLPAPLIAEQVRGSGKPGFMGALRAMVGYPIRDRLGDIACPTLVVWGERDHLVPLRDAAEFERLIPDARKVVYADTGHIPMLERPARFNADLDAFLAEQAGETRPAGSGVTTRP